MMSKYPIKKVDFISVQYLQSNGLFLEAAVGDSTSFNICK